MMRILKIKHLVQIVFLLFILSCSKDEVENTGKPGIPNLVFPENNAPCLDTNVINDEQSSVTFRWSLTRDTNSYRLFVTNLSTDQLQQFSTENPEVSATLNHGQPYSWRVRAFGPKGTAPSESETWKFYLSGPAVDNYAPFPPELTYPISGSTVTPINNLIPLQWNCSDVDNDLSSYEVYLDKVDGTTLVQILTHESETTAFETQVESGFVYYWKVIAKDAQGNESDSGVYSFRTN
tara:strand:- start:138 stop:845 length:708 start_codon:yes stop_codon:yes gene_type:complete